MQTTLIILKPDAVQRGMMGRILTRFEEKGMRVVGCRMMLIPRDLAESHYAVHAGKPFYDGLLNFMTSGPVLVMALQGLEAIDVCRKLMGATFGSKAEPGTIRGDFGVSNSFNLIHGSDSPQAAREELERFFKHGDLIDYERAIEPWVYDMTSGSPE